jgi:hypothetical protein
MTKALLEAESEGEARRAAAAVPLPALAVPASLHASLMARLDRLGPAKEMAQIGWLMHPRTLLEPAAAGHGHAGRCPGKITSRGINSGVVGPFSPRRH